MLNQDKCEPLVLTKTASGNLRKRVREADRGLPGRRMRAATEIGPAHPSDRLLAQLNESWRVVNDPLQWNLQRKKGNPRKRTSGWQGRSFCTTRKALLRCIREYCSEVDPLAVAVIETLPEHHSDVEHAK